MSLDQRLLACHLRLTGRQGRLGHLNLGFQTADLTGGNAAPGDQTIGFLKAPTGIGQRYLLLLIVSPGTL